MKLVVQIRLLPTPVQAAAPEATLRACNEAATWVSEVAFEHGKFKNFALRRLPQHPRSRTGVVATRGPVNGPCPAPAPAGRGWTQTQHHRQ
ncbi:hypothetical protein ACFP51_12875 [Streptomyces pratens]|uniref:Transposase n=1 Tax=Streptomyces pratens TaxID=887456 RepID=A0ABW1M1B1_9ACTN